MKQRHELIYTSIACNRFPGSLDLSDNHEILFGANKAVAFSKLEVAATSKTSGVVVKADSKDVKTFVRHKSKVLTVKWIKNSRGERMFVSGSNDKTAIVWSIKNENDVQITSLSGHTGPVTSVEGLEVDGIIWVATSSADNSIKIWKSDFDSKMAVFQCIQTICLANKFSLSVKFARFENQLLFMMSSGEDLQIWALKDGQFKKMLTLNGHEDWIRSIDIIGHENDLMIATGAQDNYVRIWKLSPKTRSEVEANRLDVLNIKRGNIEMEQKMISVDEDTNFAAALESVLAGHEGWVYGVQFFKEDDGRVGLMSCSIDKSIIIWYQEENGMWMDTHRIGEMGGGNLGFLGASISTDGRILTAQGFQGSFHVWCINKIKEQTIIRQELALSGHCAEVRDLEWSPQGEFLFSVSADQTTRIHAPWIDYNRVRWNEIARIQIHGYDLTSIAVISQHKIATGAEEKVVRILNTTENFIKNYRNLSNITNVLEKDEEFLRKLPKAASIPSLGLSNKAVFDNSSEQTNFISDDKKSHPPFEEDLMQNTLWPEIHKLYGHGYEIFSLAASRDLKLLASACRATTPQHAEIILWDADAAKELQKLPGHSLTVTDLKFSPDNNYLLSTSRDRSWCLFKRTGPESKFFELEVRAEKKLAFHTRIIWACDWTFDSKMFATCSRDGTVGIWTKDSDVGEPLKGWRLYDKAEVKNQSVTAISFLKSYYGGNENEYLLAVGLETGQVILYKLTTTLEQIFTLDTDQGHHMAVKRLCWCPRDDVKYLATAGEDGFVRIHNFHL